MPPYAILSHTWGSEEVTYQDMLNLIQYGLQADSIAKDRYHKIMLTCEQARHDKLDWVWIDTCNIDKTSSAELSEAINSMFQWYRSAAVCYVYIQDVECTQISPSGAAVVDKLKILRSARWFSRGWTLQELLAPDTIHFFCANQRETCWWFMGSKESEIDILAAITGIDKTVLADPTQLSNVSVARRMSWAARRQTTRPEDIAYCLLGLFQVNMPLLYGEGTNAFIRLQEEILKSSEDESLFAWSDSEAVSRENNGILASHPIAFSRSSNIVTYSSSLEPYSMTNRGLRIESRLIPLTGSKVSFQPAISLILHCRAEINFNTSISIAIEKDASTGRYQRSKDKSFRHVTYDIGKTAWTETIYVHKHGRLQTRPVRICHLQATLPWTSFKFEAGLARILQPDYTSLDPMAGNIPVQGVLGAKIPWNMERQALIAEPTQYGYHSVLWFPSVSPTSGRTSNGFVALLALVAEIEGPRSQGDPGVLLIPWMRTPNRADIHAPLASMFKQIKSCKSVLGVEGGYVKAQLGKESQFGGETWVLHISFDWSLQEDGPKKELPQAAPEIKIFTPTDEDIALTEGEATEDDRIAASLADAEPPWQNKRRRYRDQGLPRSPLPFAE